MKRLLLLAICMISLCSYGQTMAELALKEARVLNAQNKEVESLAKFKQVLAFDLQNYEALWNCSILSSRIGTRETDKTKKKELFIIAKGYADRALKISANDVAGNYVMAVALGHMALISDTKEKIAAVREIKKYAERAVELNPKHAPSLHVLGLWNLEVSDLNWVERQMADKFFGGLPDASREKALEYCKKSVEFEPNYVMYQFDLGRVYKSMGDKANAKIAFTRAVTMKALTMEDPGYQEKAKKALESF